MRQERLSLSVYAQAQRVLAWGHPDGLEGAEVTHHARLAAICDVYDAVTSKRSYKKKMDFATAVDILIRGSGPEFDPDLVLLPAWQGEPGWPVLVPVSRLDALRAISPDLMPLDVVHALVAAVPARVIELGDPGVIHDASTALADLPAYEGPPDPPAGHTHEWGVDVAAEAGLPEP